MGELSYTPIKHTYIHIHNFLPNSQLFLYCW